MRFPMGLSNLRKSIFHLQQAIRENKDSELLKALDILTKVEMKKDVDDPNKYNTTEI